MDSAAADTFVQDLKHQRLIVDVSLLHYMQSYS